MATKLSVITINYNDLKGLKKTANSVFQQSFRDIEYIVIDGGSNDGSKTFIEENKHRISHWVSEKDSGIYNAMNKGIEKATGTYIQFLNSGDVYSDDDVLKDMIAYLGEISIVYGNLVKVFSEENRRVDKGPASSSLNLATFYHGTINHPATFIKKELFKKFGMYDESLKVVSDWKFFLIAIGLNATPVRYADRNIVNFDMEGISNRNKTLRNEERSLVLQEVLTDSQKLEMKKKKTETTFKLSRILKGIKNRF